MAKLTEFKNPLKAETVELFSISDWIRSIGFVAWMGAVIALGAKLLAKVDTVVPGNVTPNAYKKTIATDAPKNNGVTIY